MRTIDARGLSCPEPVVRARAALSELAAGECVEVLVDTMTARENVLRTARALGCNTAVEMHGEEFHLRLTRVL